MAFLIAVETRDLTGVTPLFFLLRNHGVGVSSQGLFVLLPPTVSELLLFMPSVLLLSWLCRIVT